ncbi:hypothetical protein Tco_1333133 [Tanacetum coccineum]
MKIAKLKQISSRPDVWFSSNRTAILFSYLGRQVVRRTLDEGYDVRCLASPRPANVDFLHDWDATVVNVRLFTVYSTTCMASSKSLLDATTSRSDVGSGNEEGELAKDHADVPKEQKKANYD